MVHKLSMDIAMAKEEPAAEGYRALRALWPIVSGIIAASAIAGYLVAEHMTQAQHTHEMALENRAAIEAHTVEHPGD